MPNRYTLMKNEECDFFASSTHYKKSMSEKAISTKMIKKAGHIHKCYEIVLADFDDTYVYNINGKVYNVSKNCVVGATPEVWHLAEFIEKKSRIILNFSHEFGQEIFGFLGMDIKEFFKYPVWRYSDEQMERLFEIGEELVAKSKNLWKTQEKTRRYYQMKVLFLDFVNVLTQPECIVQPRGNLCDDIDVIEEYIKNNYNMALTLDGIATEFGINKYVLCRKFKNKKGINLTEYISDIKISRASKLLKDTTLTVAEIAGRTGYNSSKYFSAEFKRKTGISPLNYRKKN